NEKDMLIGLERLHNTIRNYKL
ncbi:GntR family transcriptional regulator, partial [Bacillus tropicus]|nr:GntR family transcriptional regulator [Bacillus tropicus]